jgi:hypothetical protein
VNIFNTLMIHSFQEFIQLNLKVLPNKLIYNLLNVLLYLSIYVRTIVAMNCKKKYVVN